MNKQKIATLSIKLLLILFLSFSLFVTFANAQDEETTVSNEVVSEVFLNKTDLKLGQTETVTLKPSCDNKAYKDGYTFKTSDENVASVSSKGKVTAESIGTATIYAYSSNGKKAACKITVLAAPKEVSISKKKITIGVGESFNFNSSVPEGTASYRRAYTAKDASVLQYSKSGIFTALKKGETTVTVSTFNGKKSKCKVTVLAAPKKISLNKTNLTLAVGESFNFNSSIPNGSASYKRTYTAKDTSILKYSKSGIFKALKKGKTTVSVKTYNGKKASCTVTVLPLPNEISCSKSSYNLSIGTVKKADIKIPSGTYCSSFKCTSSDKSVAYCDSKGKIHALKMGSATITVKTANGKKCSFKVTVKAMGVPFVNQFPNYPTGCEAASCTSLLKYYGYNITLDQMIAAIPRKSIYYKNGKRWGPDINKYFVGNPRGTYTSSDAGYGAFSPCVTKALQKVINERGGKHTATKISGCSFKTLLSHISSGRPAIVWATYKMNKPQSVNSWYITDTGKYFEYPRGTHVLVLVGYSNSRVTLVDPCGGTVSYDIGVFEDRWELLGKQAIVLMK